jgi:hypothetical protein
MPGFILHQGATVICLHGGQAEPTAPSQRVMVDSQPIVTESAPRSIAGCSFNVSGAPVPCVTAQWVVAATRVQSEGIPVLLQDSTAVCIPNGTGVNILMTQTRVSAT